MLYCRVGAIHAQTAFGRFVGAVAGRHTAQLGAQALAGFKPTGREQKAPWLTGTRIRSGHFTVDEETSAKRAAGYFAVDRYVNDGDCIGLGTGTTAYWAIERVGQRVASGQSIAAVATSTETEHLCRKWNVPVLPLLQRPIAVAIDGADEVAADWAVIKGGGGALFREKAVALCAQRFVVVVTQRKLVDRLGAVPLPIEVVPYAAPYVKREVTRRFPSIAIARRETDEHPYVTDNHNWIFDCHFGRIESPARLDQELRAIHGVVSTGLFFGIASDVIVGQADGTAKSLPRA